MLLFSTIIISVSTQHFYIISNMRHIAHDDMHLAIITCKYSNCVIACHV